MRVRKRISGRGDSPHRTRPRRRSGETKQEDVLTGGGVSNIGSPALLNSTGGAQLPEVVQGGTVSEKNENGSENLKGTRLKKHKKKTPGGGEQQRKKHKTVGGNNRGFSTLGFRSHQKMRKRDRGQMPSPRFCEYESGGDCKWGLVERGGHRIIQYREQNRPHTETIKKIFPAFVSKSGGKQLR